MAKKRRRRRRQAQNKIQYVVQTVPPSKKPWWKRLGAWVAKGLLALLWWIVRPTGLILLLLTIGGSYFTYRQIRPNLLVEVTRAEDLFDANFILKNDGKFSLEVDGCKLQIIYIKLQGGVIIRDTSATRWGKMPCKKFTLDPGQEHTTRIPLGIESAGVLEAAVCFSVPFNAFNFNGKYYYRRTIERGFSADRALNRAYWISSSCEELRTTPRR
jgi:hypothetical protein